MLRHPLRWIIGALIVVVLAVGGAVAWYVFSDSAPAKPKLGNATATTVAGAANSSPDGTWHLATGKDVYVGYRIKELFAGARLKKDAVGRTGDATGSLRIASDHVTTTSIQAKVSTLQSNRSPRDQYIHTHALESDRFPRATFTLTKPIDLPSGLRAGATVHDDATGNLTLHGVTRPVTLTLDARWNGATIEVAGTAPIVLADYAIDPPRTAIVSVDDHGALEVHLVFRRA